MCGSSHTLSAHPATLGEPKLIEKLPPAQFSTSFMLLGSGEGLGVAVPKVRMPQSLRMGGWAGGRGSREVRAVGKPKAPNGVEQCGCR